MDPRTRRRQIDAERERTRRELRYRRGVVTATDPITVLISGTPVPIQALESATLTIGDRVLVAAWDSQMVVLDRLKTSM